MSKTAELLNETVSAAGAILMMILLPLAGVAVLVAGAVLLCRYFRRSK